MNPRDTDPLMPDDLDRAYAEGFAHGWDDAPQAPRSSIPVLLALVVGVVLGSLVSGVVRAAPRPVPLAEASQTGAPLRSQVEAHSDGSPPPPTSRGAALDAASEEPGSASNGSGQLGGAPTPSPTGEIAALVGGTATYCAPTPTHCQSWGGAAHLGAVQSFTYGDRPYRVLVSYGSRQTIVTVVSYCACPQTLIDLSPAAFADLAPLRLGRILVTVEWPAPGEPPPATDTEAVP